MYWKTPSGTVLDWSLLKNLNFIEKPSTTSVIHTCRRFDATLKEY